MIATVRPTFFLRKITNDSALLLLPCQTRQLSTDCSRSSLTCGSCNTCLLAVHTRFVALSFEQLELVLGLSKHPTLAEGALLPDP